MLLPESRLESTTVSLEERGESKAVIRFVEKWSETGRPTPRARLAQARAFYDLRLVDRATIRLRELTDHPELGGEALKLIGQCMLIRGWPSKARAPLRKASALLPEDMELLELMEGTKASPAGPDRAAEESSDPERLRSAAEHHLATGSFLKAQTLLEKSRRLKPNNKRAADLLWGLAGDYSTQESLSDLCIRWGPEVELADLDDEAENTEAISLADLPHIDMGGDDEGDKRAFPALFRNLDAPDPGAFDTEERTQASSISSVQQLQDDMDAASPDAPTDVDDADDTQIAHVIRNRGSRPGPAEDTTGHVPGPPPSAADRSDFDAGLEEEDDDLIILTGKERTATGPGSPEGMLLDPDPTTSEVIGQVVDLLDRVRADIPPASEAPTQVLDDPPAKKKPRKKRRKSRSMPAAWWLFMLGGVLMLGTAALLLLALVSALSR